MADPMTFTSSVSCTLPDAYNDLSLTGGVAANFRLPDKQIGTLYGNPLGWAKYLDYFQGDNALKYYNDCGVVTCENLLIQTGNLNFKLNYSASLKKIDCLETELVEYAKDNGYINSSDPNPNLNGTMSFGPDFTDLLSDYGLSSMIQSMSLNSVAEALKNNYAVGIAVDAYVLWGMNSSFNEVNHAITVTGVAYNDSNSVIGFYICDSGTMSKKTVARYISYSELSKSYGGYSVVSSSSNKLYIENINGIGNANDNVIMGNYGNNVLSGLGGNDTLDGLYGADTLIGGMGDDTYILHSTRDRVIERKNYVSKKILYDFGIDTIKFAFNSNFNSYTISSNVENIDAAENLNGLILKGNILNNSITGSLFNDSIFGFSGNDTIYASDGDDYVDGGAGIDTMHGGDGDDTYVINCKDDVVIDTAFDIADTVLVSSSFIGNVIECSTGNYQNITLMDARSFSKNLTVISPEFQLFTGRGNDTIYGNSATDFICSGSGNDFIFAGEGDYLEGQAGNDTYVLDSVDLYTTIYDSSGVDTLKLLSTVTQSSYVLNDTIEILNAKEAGSVFNLSGNTLLNTVYGGDSNNTLDGGVDSYADKLYGGAGDDTYLLFTNDRAFESINQGIDKIIFDPSNMTKSYSLDKSYIEVLDASSTSVNHKFSGSIFSDTIIGGRGIDYISGGKGNDSLNGYIGNDTLVGGAGSDLYYFDASYQQIDKVIETASSIDSDIVSLFSTTADDVLMYKNISGNYILDYGQSTGMNVIDFGKIFSIERIQIVNEDNDVLCYITTEQINSLISAIGSLNSNDTNANLATISDISMQKAYDTTLIAWSTF